MPEKIIDSFHVKRLDILDEKGDADIALMPSLSDAYVRRMYELLVLLRTFDQVALSLQREGRLGTYASVLGQEASQVGTAFALEKTDWIFPSFREMGVYITMGYPMHMLLQYWGGDERGISSPEGLNIFPICIPVATHIPHAAGAAMAAKYRKDRIAVIAYFGDGGTSEGDFHEGLEYGRRIQAAGCLCLPEQSVGDISAEGKTDCCQRPLRRRLLPMALKGSRWTAMIYLQYTKLLPTP